MGIPTNSVTSLKLLTYQRPVFSSSFCPTDLEDQRGNGSNASEVQKTVRTEEDRGEDFSFPENIKKIVQHYVEVEGGTDPDDLEELEDAQSLAKVNLFFI